MAAAATFLVYFGLAAFAMEGAFGDLTLAAMWPASGLAVAVLASVDRRAQPWHALAVLAASVSASLAFDVPPGRSVLYGLANLAEPLVAVALLSRLPKAGPSLSDPRQLLGFCLAAAGGSVVGTVIASAAVGWSDPIFGIIWFATDFMGIVLVAPPSFQFFAWLKSGRRLRASVKLFYALALVLAADLATFSQGDLPLLFVPTLALIAAASIAGQGGAATGVLLTAVIGSVAGAHGTGPIPANAFGPGTHIYFLQGYLLVMMGSALPMAALHENRQRLIAALTERTRLLVMAERMAGLGHWHLDLEDGGLVWSDEVYRIHGAPDGFKPDLAFALAAYHPDDRQELETVLDAAIRKGGDFRHQARIVRTDGCVRHLLLKGEVIFEDRTAKTLFGVVQDITRQIENEALLEAARLSAEEAAAQATFLAETDALTSVPNRRKVLATLDAMLAAARVDDSSLAVAMFDIDRFKSINDTYGHVVGDAVLRRVALSASATIRAGDVVGRLGGEEFLVLLPGADRLTAMQIGEAVRQRIAAHELGDSEPAATASVGIALLGRDEDAESLLRRADIALYAAKTGGRNVLQVAA